MSETLSKTGGLISPPQAVIVQPPKGGAAQRWQGAPLGRTPDSFICLNTIPTPHASRCILKEDARRHLLCPLSRHDECPFFLPRTKAHGRPTCWMPEGWQRCIRRFSPLTSRRSRPSAKRFYRTLREAVVRQCGDGHCRHCQSPWLESHL